MLVEKNGTFRKITSPAKPSGSYYLNRCFGVIVSVWMFYSNYNDIVLVEWKLILNALLRDLDWNYAAANAC